MCCRLQLKTLTRTPDRVCSILEPIRNGTSSLRKINLIGILLHNLDNHWGSMYYLCFPPSRFADRVKVGTEPLKAIGEEKKHLHGMPGIWLGQDCLVHPCMPVSLGTAVCTAGPGLGHELQIFTNT